MEKIAVEKLLQWPEEMCESLRALTGAPSVQYCILLDTCVLGAVHHSINEQLSSEVFRKPANIFLGLTY